ncbi:MAG: hypothetical protein JWM11_5500 [Planctomycetaceae bacterium]|nr:hypothetical protein [Planctomycetaceae bacterium]
MQIANYEPSQRRRGSNSNCCDRRAGFCATGEVLLILGIVAALILGLNLALTSLSGTPMDARKVSDRLIYDILVDDDEQSLWINEFSKDII